MKNFAHAKSLVGLLAAIVLLRVPQVGRSATPSAVLDERLSAAVTRGDVPGLVVIAATRDRTL
jgi:hypothetical protein